MEQVKYRFNIEEIRKQINDTKTLLNSYTISGRTKRSLESTLKDVEISLLPLLHPKRATKKESDILDDAYDIFDEEEILDLPNIVEQTILNSLPILVGKQGILNFPGFHETGYSDDCFFTNHEIVEIVQEFYQETFHIDIKPMLKDRNNSLLQFDYCKDSPFHFFGTTYLNPFNLKNYINIIRCNKIEDLITTAHEVCHMMHMNRPFDSSTDMYFLGEADTMFTEKIFLDFLKEKGIYHQDLIEAMQIDYLYDACCHATSIAVNYALDGNLNFSHVKRKTIEEYFRKNKWSFPFTKDEILSYQEGNTVNVLRSSYRDLFCYYTALDLYYEYQKDPEKAKYHYQLFGKIPTENFSFFLRSIGATFQNGDYHNLENEVKKYTKKK